MIRFEEVDDGQRIKLMFVAIFLVVVAGGIIDLTLDRPVTLWSVHVGFEVFVVGISLASAAYLARGWYRTEVSLARAAEDAERIDRERVAWQERAETAIRSFAAEVEQQLDSWSLTPAETRVALMLLKGSSHKRIARLTGISERTVRQHAVAVYRKAGLAGRAELAGFFLGAIPEGGGGGESRAPGAAPSLPSRS